MTTTAVPASSVKPRREALGPFQAQLATLLEQHGGRSGPLEIQIHSQRMTVNPWQKGALAAALAGGSPPEAGVARIVADGIALQAKGLTDLDRLERAPFRSQEERDQVLSELVYDTALGLALTSEIRKTAEALTGAGRRGLASNLGQIGGSLLALVKELEPRIGTEALETAHKLAAQLEIDHSQAGSKALDLPVGAVAPGSLGGTIARARTGGGSSFDWRHALVAVTVTLAVVVIGAGAWLYLTGPAPVTMERAAQIEGVMSVDGVPPQAKVTLDLGRWNQLDAGKRTALVFGVASVLKRNGYREAEFLLPGGALAARWEEGQSVELLGEAPR